MAGFADLVPLARAALFNEGVADSVAAGRSYRLRITDVVDNADDPIDLTSVTGTCKVVAADRTTEVLDITFTGALGEFTLSADEDDTAGLFSGIDYSKGRVCYWYLVLDDGTDSVQVWMVDNSTFTIRKGA